MADLQIDNQLLDTSCPILLHTVRTTSDDDLPTSALILKAKLLPSPNKNAIIFEYLTFDIKPCVLILEERLILKTAYFFGVGKMDNYKANKEYDHGQQNIEELSLSTNPRRFYFESLNIGSSQVIAKDTRKYIYIYSYRLRFTNMGRIFLYLLFL